MLAISMGPNVNAFNSPMPGAMPGFPSAALDRLGGMGMQPNPLLEGMMQSQSMIENCMLMMMEMLMKLMVGNSSSGANTGTAPIGGTSDSSGNSYGGSSGGSSGGASSATDVGGGFGAANPSGTLADIQGGTALGNEIARDAQSQASSMNSHGWCLRGVSRALAKAGIDVHGAAAYEAADQLAHNPKFREVQVGRAELPKLPPGAIIVWNRSGAHPYGHISVALGDGREASDHIQKQITNLGSGESYRVFMPK